MMAACSERTLRRHCKKKFDSIVAESKRRKEDILSTSSDDEESDFQDEGRPNSQQLGLNMSFLEEYCAEFDGKLMFIPTNVSYKI